MPIFTLALAIPMVRTNSRSFCSAKICSSRERTFDFSALTRGMAWGIGLPLGFLRWTRLTKPFFSMNSSFAANR